MQILSPRTYLLKTKSFSRLALVILIYFLGFQSTFATTLPDPYDFTCSDGVEVEIYGDGIQGQTTATLNLPNPSTIDSFKVVAINKGGTAPASVTFSTNNGQNIVAGKVISANAPNGNSCNNCAAYFGDFSSANSVSINTNGATTVWSFVAYIFRSNSNSAGSIVSIPLNEYFYKGDDDFWVAIPGDSGPRDIIIDIPITELTNDSRVAEITANAGSVQVIESFNTYDPALGQSLKVATITLQNVPGSVTGIDININSPNSGGDSFVVGGYINIRTNCVNEPWNNTCAEGVQVEVVGKGIEGMTSATINLPNPGIIDSFKVVAINKGATPPAFVSFSTNNGQTADVNPQTSQNAPNGVNCSNCAAYIADFGPANSVSINTQGGMHIWSFVAYVFTTNANSTAAVTAIPINTYFYKGDDSYTISIPTDDNPRDITIDIPVTELTDDVRVAEITATAGGVQVFVSENTFDPILGESLRIISITLNDVPGSASSITIDIDSPNSGGDSFVVGGYLSLTTDCPDYDFGDNPSSYGDFGILIDKGTPAWFGSKSPDREDIGQYSANADGDDLDGNDDEDGVTFVGGTELVPGTNHVVKIDWNSYDADSYIYGYIDFNGDGDFDPLEIVVGEVQVGSGTAGVLASGTAMITFAVPSSAICGASYARFYIHTSTGIQPVGVYHNDGEVEDYGVSICSTVPIELLSFEGKQQDTYVALDWKTANEINNAGFEIQHLSEVSDHWEVIGFVESSVNFEAAQYDYLDRDPDLEMVNYYRLKQIDYDGTFAYSDVVAVEMDKSIVRPTVQIYPNPSNSAINFNIPEGVSEIRILNVLGETVYLSKDLNGTIEVSNFADGLYWIELTAQSGPITGAWFTVKK